MPTATLIKINSDLFEVETQSDSDKLKRIGQGECIEVKWEKVRDSLNHRRFFAMLQIIFENQDFFNDIDQMRKWLTCKAGHFEVIKCPNGNKLYQARSIQYAKMDEAEFQGLKERVAEVACAELIDMTKEDLDGEVEEQVIKLGFIA